MGSIRGCASLWPGFFFQAEDGIRDDLVTGVQTCALPISLLRARVGFGEVPDSEWMFTRARAGGVEQQGGHPVAAIERRLAQPQRLQLAPFPQSPRPAQPSLTDRDEAALLGIRGVACPHARTCVQGK